MGNCINRLQEGHRPVATPPPRPPARPPVDFVYCGNTAPAVAAAAIAAPMSTDLFFKGSELAMVHLPEAAPLLLNAFRNEMAPAHGLAQLYQTLAGGDYRNLPTASALQADLNLYSMADATTDKALVHDTLTLLSKQIPGLLAAPAVHPEVILKVAEVGRALFNVHEYISNNRANSAPKLTLDHLTPLLSLFTQATTRTGRGARLAPTRHLVAAKHAELTRAELRGAINAIRISGGRALEHMNPRLKNNREVVMEAIRLDGSALEFASEELQDDSDVVMNAVENNGSAFQFASERIRNDPGQVTAAVRLSGYALQYTNESLRNNREIVKAAVQAHGTAIQYASHAMKNDLGILKIAVLNDSNAFQFASEATRGDFDVVQALVRINSFALEFASEALRGNQDIVMAALEDCGFAIKFASEELKDTYVVAMAAVQKDGAALKFVSPALRNNRYVVIAAVHQDGYALQWAGREPLNDLQVVRAALVQNVRAIQFVYGNMRYHPEIFALVARHPNPPAAYILRSVYADLPDLMARLDLDQAQNR